MQSGVALRSRDSALINVHQTDPPTVRISVRLCLQRAIRSGPLERLGAPKGASTVRTGSPPIIGVLRWDDIHTGVLRLKGTIKIDLYHRYWSTKNALRLVT